MHKAIVSGIIALIAALSVSQAAAQAPPSCPVEHGRLADILKKSVKPSGGPSNGGLDNNEWAAVVNRQGVVCAVAYSGSKMDDQWLGSPAIAAEKANTAQAVRLKKKAVAPAKIHSGGPPRG